MRSKLKERFARLGRVRDVDRVTSGSSAVVVLERMHDEPRPIDAVMALARRGASLLKAKRTIEEVIETRRRVGISLPVVEDRLALVRELHEGGILAQVVRDDPVDVRALRERLGHSQDQFSLIYNIPLDTLRKWERSEREPDTAAMNFLRLIETDPGLLGIYGEEGKAVGRIPQPGDSRRTVIAKQHRTPSSATAAGGSRRALTGKKSKGSG